MTAPTSKSKTNNYRLLTVGRCAHIGRPRDQKNFFLKYSIPHNTYVYYYIYCKFISANTLSR